MPRRMTGLLVALSDIAVMRNIDGVVKSGRLVVRDAELLPLLDPSIPQRY